MAERFLDLALADRREALDVAASASGRTAYLLKTLFAGPLGAPLVFKGGRATNQSPN